MMKANDIGRRAMWAVWLFNIGLICVMVGTALPLLRVDGAAYRYIYCAGAVLALTGKLMRPVPKDIPFPVKRLMRVEVWGALMFCAGGFFMWYTSGAYGSMDWIAFTLAGAVIQIYTSIMIPKRMSNK